ncbi:MAG: AhpC/TSA family protein [Flavobacteriales bacterium]|nr:AhpC/TSA family protein [Flavobacteriales bacterium]MCB9191721.1 AhpC/TSA family protein [Flavobacteriales bacterium]MCB9203617.1 AhpC/TSA family protein [Flavobacteriales bacterium]
MRKPIAMNVLVQLLVAAALWSCGADSTQKNTESPPPSETSGSGKMHIEITVNGAGNDVAKMLGVFGNQNFLVDSAKADANGLFVFDADSLLPKGFYYVMLASDNSYFQMLLGADQEFNMSAAKGNYVPSMKVQGDIDNELLYRNLQFEADFNQRLQPVKDQLSKVAEGSPEHTKLSEEQDKLIEERKAHVASYADEHPNSFFTQFKLSGQNPELTFPKLPNGELDQTTQVYRYRKAFFTGVDFDADWTMRTPVFANKLRKYIKELTPQNADSLIKYADELIAKTKGNKELFKFTVNWIALEYKTPKTMGTEALYVHMIDTYWTNELAWWSNPEEIKGLRGEISLMKPSLLGKIGQDISGTDENGNAVSLYGLKSPIKVVYIYSYECEHCQKETPDMVRVYNQWKNKGVDVFALCTDKEKAPWLDFVRQNNMNFTNCFDPERKSRYERKYHIDITPELYVLDKNNKIIASNLSPNQLPDFLEAERGRNPW